MFVDCVCEGLIVIEYNHIIMVVAVLMAYALADRVVAMIQCSIDCIP